MQGARCDLQEYFVIWMNKSVFGNRKDFTLVHIFFYKCSIYETIPNKKKCIKHTENSVYKSIQ